MSPASYQTAPPRDVVRCLLPVACCLLPVACSSQPVESGKRDSNPRPQPWQGCALPTELFPRRAGSQPTRPTLTGATRITAPPPDANGGEGDRTPDLVNAIHALSQLSYAPAIFCSRREGGRSTAR